MTDSRRPSKINVATARASARLLAVRMVAVLALTTLGACRLEPPPGSGTPGPEALEACRAMGDRGTRCYALGLNHFAESDPGRVFGLRAFSAACDLGHADACYSAAVLLEGPRERSFFDRACTFGHVLSCDRAAERRGTRGNSCPSRAPIASPTVELSSGDSRGSLRGSLPLPRYARRPLPAYPASALAARLEAIVTACVFFDATGAVASVQIAGEAPAFAEHVRGVVSTWRIAPYLHEGRAVAVMVRHPFDFKVP